MANSRILRLFLAGLLLLGLLPLCAGATHQQKGWDFIRSENFDYYYQAERDPFPERVPIALERLEWFHETVAPLWGYPAGKRITYYRYPSREDLAAASGRDANGFAILNKAEVHTISLADAHEVAHLFTTQNLFYLFNNCRLSTFWMEGIAMYYTWPLVYYCNLHNPLYRYPIGTWYGRSVHCRARELLLQGNLLAIGPCIYENDHFESAGYQCSYPAAGSFITFLLGPGQSNPEQITKMKDFFLRINYARSEKQVADAFAQVFGATIEEVENDWHIFLKSWSECHLEEYCTCPTSH
jgi:hypothetical protein